MTEEKPLSEAAKRLQELKMKLLSGSKPLAPKAEDAGPPPLPSPAPRPLTRDSSERKIESSDEKPKKTPLTLRSLMGQKKKQSEAFRTPVEEKPVAPAAVHSGSRLKEAPAHRAMMAESKTNLIRSKVISLTKSGVAEKIAHFEENPPPVNPFAVLFPPLSYTDQYVVEKRTWLADRMREHDLVVPQEKRTKLTESQNVREFIDQHRRFLDALVAIK
jgi:hypothetical protein